MISDVDFLDSLVVLGFPKEHNEILKQVRQYSIAEKKKQQRTNDDSTIHIPSLSLQFYIENRMEIRNLLMKLTFQLPHYVDLDWRLDIQVFSSKTNHSILKIDRH
jgi:hypothetical protein